MKTNTPTSVRVLLIEDNPADARLVTEFLLEAKPERFEVTHAPRLSRALESLRAEGFHAIVLDLGLPDSQGLETVVRARAEAPGAPIIVLTALDDEQTARDAVANGAQDYFVKGAVTSQLLRHALVFAIERNRVEAATRDREERFRQLTEHMAEVFVVFDHELKETLYVSPGYAKVWGRSRTSLYERPGSFFDAVKPEDLSAVRENVARAQSGRDDGEIEFRITRPDGEARWILSHVTPVRNAEGEPYRIAGVCMDVTERRRSIDALEESEARYRLLSETSFDGVAVSEAGIIREANNGMAEIFGYGMDELIGKPIIDLIAEESVHEVRRRIDENVHGRYELVAKHRNGHQMRIEVTTNSQIFRGRLRRVAAIRDLTEKKNLERQILQAQRMEAVGRLAGGVAHDFNNLITVITSYTSVVLSENTLSQPVRHDLGEVSKAADSAASLSRQLLAFSRHQPVEPKSLDLNDVVLRAEKMLQRVIGEDITLRTNLGVGLGQVLADFGQLEQVIMNMAINARDAMPHGGELTIETVRVDLAEEFVHNHFAAKAGSYVRLGFRDTGVGMGEETLSHIFEPFYTTKETGKGTGLGLSTVYGIVQQIGGHITVDSVLGKGTTFYIYLPRTEAAPELEIPAATNASPRGSETVLLVEDVPAVRDIVRRVLVGRGYTVLDAVDAAAAVARSASHHGPIHLLLTDVVLPGESGRELAEQLRPARPDMKVLFMSGYTEDTVPRGDLLGRDLAFLQKPFTPEALARRVREVLD
jgi:PAS domain S-box-containing protein